MVAKTISTAFILLAVKTGPTPVEMVEQMGKPQVDLEKVQRKNNDAQSKFNSRKWLADQQPKHARKMDASHHSLRYR